MKVLRTPDKHFQSLPDFDFEPTYTVIHDADGTELRIHSVDIGPRDAEPILLMHGNPSWAYLYRHVIKGLIPTGKRIIAIDLVGLGKSDKPAKRSYYSVERHLDWLTKWLETNNLNNITLVCQDWGGVLGLWLVANYPERFSRVFATNTTVPIGDGGNKVLRIWQTVMKWMPCFPWKVAFAPSFQSKTLSTEEYKAYLAPFPQWKYQSGIMQFPQLIPVFANNPAVPIFKDAWQKLGNFKKPFLTVFGTHDPITKGEEKRLQAHIPGCKGQAHERLYKIGHFSPEEAPELLVERIIPFLDVN
ncbi:haloalkane dehalogenase [Glaciecola petra]|uniref:Haloalkane dehalogenase n=1 Tax=Glaciecola petra TaxID=3075602 RepID=A0ABU2ZV05_9ALTE|nr:haloalkane dehalogenase [Aestuariibacter sp. P117]MDT0596476.1 haloalkane dehalogenase [Aestuariibacter sp. P117]